MNKFEIIRNLKNDGMDFIHNNFHNLTEDEKRELILSGIYVIGNNNLDDEYFKDLEENL